MSHPQPHFISENMSKDQLPYYQENQDHGKYYLPSHEPSTLEQSFKSLRQTTTEFLSLISDTINIGRAHTEGKNLSWLKYKKTRENLE